VANIVPKLLNRTKSVAQCSQKILQNVLLIQITFANN